MSGTPSPEIAGALEALGASVPDRALVNQAPAGLGPSGFDPSRDDEFWGPEIVVEGVCPEWLGEREPFVWLRTSEWLAHFRTAVKYDGSFASSTRDWCWAHSDGRPCIRGLRLPANHPAYAASAIEAGTGETRQGLDPQDESAVPKADAKNGGVS